MSDTTSPAGPSVPPPTLCPSGHAVPTGQAFCGVCGAVVTPNAPTTMLPSSPPPSVRGTLSRIPALAWVGIGVVGVVMVVVAASVATRVVGAAASGVGGVITPSQTVTVEFSLFDDSVGDGDCDPGGGYGDISGGTPVTLRNDKGTILAAASLGSNTTTDMFECTWTVVLTDVPGDEKFYSVEVSDRGAITESRDELAADGWTFSISLGL